MKENNSEPTLHWECPVYRWYMLDTHSIDVLRCWCVCSIGAMAFKSEIIFCTGKEIKKLKIFLKKAFYFHHCDLSNRERMFYWIYLRVWGVDIMNSYSAFNAPKGKSSWFVHFVFENGNTAVLNLRKTQRSFRLRHLFHSNTKLPSHQCKVKQNH